MFSSEKSNDLPLRGSNFISGSTNEENCRLKPLSPVKTERTMNKAAEAIITPPEAINVMIFIALLLLFENRYRFAIYSGKFTYDFLRFPNKSGFSMGSSPSLRERSIPSIYSNESSIKNSSVGMRRN